MAHHIAVVDTENRGEIVAFKYFRENLPGDWVVITNSTPRNNEGRFYELDAIIIGNRCVWVIDNKNYYGRIEGDLDNWDLEGSNETKRNIVYTVMNRARFLKNLLEKNNRKLQRIWVEGMITLSHPNAKIGLKDNDGGVRQHIHLLNDSLSYFKNPEVFVADLRGRPHLTWQNRNDIIKRLVSSRTLQDYPKIFEKTNTPSEYTFDTYPGQTKPKNYKSNTQKKPTQTSTAYSKSTIIKNIGQNSLKRIRQVAASYQSGEYGAPTSDYTYRPSVAPKWDVLEYEELPEEPLELDYRTQPETEPERLLSASLFLVTWATTAILATALLRTFSWLFEKPFVAPISITLGLLFGLWTFIRRRDEISAINHIIFGVLFGTVPVVLSRFTQTEAGYIALFFGALGLTTYLADSITSHHLQWMLANPRLTQETRRKWQTLWQGRFLPEAQLTSPWKSPYLAGFALVLLYGLISYGLLSFFTESPPNPFLRPLGNTALNFSPHSRIFHLDLLLPERWLPFATTSTQTILSSHNQLAYLWTLHLCRCPWRLE